MVEKQVNVNVNAKDNASSKIGTFTKNLGTVAANFNALKQAAQSVWNGVKDLIKAFQEQEKASAKLTQALKNQGIYTAETQKSIEDYSSSLQQASLFGNELITTVQAGLTTVGLQGEELKRATQATLDFASASGQDLVSAGKLVEKAAAGQASAFSRYGITAKDLNGVLGQLEGRYGGMAKAIADTPTGKLVQLANTWGDLKETLGELAVKIISPFVEGLKTILDVFNSMPKTIQFLVIGLAALAAGWVAVGVAANFATLGIPALIFAIVSGIGLLSANFDKVKAALAKVIEWFLEFTPIGRLIDTVVEKLGGFPAIFEKIKQAAAAAFSTIVGWLNKIPGVNIGGNNSGAEAAEKKQTQTTAAQLEERRKLQEYYAKEAEKIEADSLNARRALNEEFLNGEINDAEYKAQLDYQKAEEELALLEMQYMSKLEMQSLDDETRLQMQADYQTQRQALLDQMNTAEMAANMSSVKGFINMIDLKKSKNKELAQDFSTWSSFMIQAQNSDNKILAAAGKALAIYDITNRTSEAAMAGFDAGMKSALPFPLNIAAAITASGLAVAFGAEQIAKVNSNTLALAEGGTFTATQPTYGQLGGQPIEFGEAGAEQVTFQPLENGDGEGQKCYIVIEGSSTDTLVEALYYKTKDWERRSGLS